MSGWDMAILDPRILPLIETLAASGMDWLAFELVNGVARGHLPEESEDALARARQRASSPVEAEAPFEEGELAAEPEPILGEDQLRWAVAYVDSRLADTIDALEGSFIHLQAIDRSTVDEVGVRPIRPLALVLVDGEQSYEVGPGGTHVARNGLELLRAALNKWLAEDTRSGPQI
jgi:hypothetical protein